MATTIKSTDLDFNAIRNSLKTYLASQDEFKDYNFEGSALSNLLDVLAYNTHHNGLVANFALNESFLSTAQLRSSLVALAGGLGYTVGSRSASFGVVNLYIENVSNPSSMTLPAGFTFSAKVDNTSYTFKTRETLTAFNDGNNFYYFQLNGNGNVPIYEGITRRKTFISGPSSSNDTYVIPTSNLDLDTVVVRVYDDFSTSNYNLYTNINDATTINENSRIYVIKESPNGFYELNFGNGVRLGQTPSAGNKIEVLYDAVSGPEANGARNFTPNATLDGYEVKVVTVSNSTGGSYKEEIDSIRKNAPYQYAAQNRMVTAEDYSALILRNFSNVIDDIKSWGGEDNVPPQYGTVFVSLNFAEGTNNTIQEITKSNIRALVRDFSVVSFDVAFADPIETYLEVVTRFQFNPNLTSSSQTAIEQSVKTIITSYFDENLGGFDQSFRRSNMLTDVDDIDPSVLSSRAEVKMQKRFVPNVSTTNYVIEYPAPIAAPDDVNYIVQSGKFLFNGKSCKLRNKLNTNSIEVIDLGTGAVIVNNIGYYDANNGILYLSGFNGSIISGDHIKITAIPSNQSVINPLRNNILKFDDGASFAFATLTDTV
jgi:hypothetical protein